MAFISFNLIVFLLNTVLIGILKQGTWCFGPLAQKFRIAMSNAKMKKHLLYGPMSCVTPNMLLSQPQVAFQDHLMWDPSLTEDIASLCSRQSRIDKNKVPYHWISFVRSNVL
jgi:hypothetical protein